MSADKYWVTNDSIQTNFKYLVCCTCIIVISLVPYMYPPSFSLVKLINFYVPFSQKTVENTNLRFGQRILWAKIYFLLTLFINLHFLNKIFKNCLKFFIFQRVYNLFTIILVVFFPNVSEVSRKAITSPTTWKKEIKSYDHLYDVSFEKGYFIVSVTIVTQESYFKIVLHHTTGLPHLLLISYLILAFALYFLISFIYSTLIDSSQPRPPTILINFLFIYF